MRWSEHQPIFLILALLASNRKFLAVKATEC